MTARTHSGLVVLIGAGPGDASLITAAGAAWLSKADVIVYDRLVNPALLESASEQAEKVYVGKTPAGQGHTQEQISALLVKLCRSGKLVVRLKGGDPLVFGRGGEEADALTEASCAFRIVPGVSAGIAAGAYAGIPLTDRRVASTVAFVTGHEDAANDRSSIAWDALAKLDTLVFYMGVGNLPVITQRLLAAGRDGQTPAAVIENATTPRQRTIVTTLAALATEAEAAGIRPPALIVIGEVAGFHERQGWWEKLPLFGQTVLVTRSRRQVSRLSAKLAELGAEVIEAPTIRIEPPEDFGPLDAALGRLEQFDWLVLTSPNGATALLDRMEVIGLGARALADVQIAAVGPATAGILRERFIAPDLVADPHTTEALAKALISQNPIDRKRILLARSDIAPDELARVLRRAGGEVEEITAYRTVRPESLPQAAADALSRGEVDWITFTSSSTVENFLALADVSKVNVGGVKPAAIGPVTGRALQGAGLTPAVVADPHTIDALVEAMAAFAR